MFQRKAFLGCVHICQCIQTSHQRTRARRRKTQHNDCNDRDHNSIRSLHPPKVEKCLEAQDTICPKFETHACPVSVVIRFALSPPAFVRSILFPHSASVTCVLVQFSRIACSSHQNTPHTFTKASEFSRVSAKNTHPRTVVSLVSPTRVLAHTLGSVHTGGSVAQLVSDAPQSTTQVHQSFLGS